MKGAMWLLVAAVVAGVSCCGSSCLVPTKFPIGVALKLTGTKGCQFTGQYSNPQQFFKVDSVVPATYTIAANGTLDELKASFCIKTRVDTMGNTIADTLWLQVYRAGEPVAHGSADLNEPCIGWKWTAPWH
jgi:hypothetical protein